MKKHFATLNGIKRAAIKLRRRTGAKHSEALNQIARDAGFTDYHAAAAAYKAGRISLAGLTRITKIHGE